MTQTRPPWRWVLLLCGLYLMSGMVDHDPWKTEDARHIAIAYGFFIGRDSWIPHLAGVVWPSAEPLYYWLAAATAWLTRGVLPFHEGARLASAVFGAIALVGLENAARHGFHKIEGIAPLLAIGTLGLLTLHEAQPAVATLAAASVVYWGMAQCRNHSVIGAFITGTGLGAGFLSGGFLMLPPLLPLLFLEHRRPQIVLLAMIFAVPWIAGWMIALAYAAPTFLEAWWRLEIEGLSAWHRPTLAHLKLLIWFTWPVLPLAFWSIWVNRRRLHSLLLPLVGSLCALLWFLAHEARYTLALPLLIPLVLLASDGSIRLRRGAASAWDWFGCVTFTGAMGLIWLGASALLLEWPTQIARNFAKLAPGFHAEISIMALMMGCGVTFVWGWLLIKLPRSPWRPVGRWASGVTLSWALLTLLWMPWINAYKVGRHLIP